MNYYIVDDKQIPVKFTDDGKIVDAKTSQEYVDTKKAEEIIDVKSSGKKLHGGAVSILSILMILLIIALNGSKVDKVYSSGGKGTIAAITNSFNDASYKMTESILAPVIIVLMLIVTILVLRYFVDPHVREVEIIDKEMTHRVFVRERVYNNHLAQINLRKAN